MKKLIIVALLAIGITSFAQEGKKKKGNEISTEMRLKKMTEELSLNSDQQKKLAPVLEEQAANMKAMKENPDSRDENRAKMKETGKKMKDILTAEQFEKWKANMGKGKGQREGKMKKQAGEAEE
jgi:C1A family cysteine protease